MEILIICAHPDDECLGMGATIYRHTRGDDHVHIVVMASGITSRDKSVTTDVNALLRNSVKALGILGVEPEQITYLCYPDQKLDTLPRIELTKEIERVMERVRPDIIYTHSPTDTNLDHRVVYDAVITAARPVKAYIKKILCFEVVSSTEWSGVAFNPNYFNVVLECDLEKKLEALKKYESEMRNPPHPRSYENIRNLAKVRGNQVCCAHAEAFVLVREIVG